MNCLEYIKTKYYIKGYSWDLIYELENTNKDPNECETLFHFLEARYG